MNSSGGDLWLPISSGISVNDTTTAGSEANNKLSAPPLTDAVYRLIASYLMLTCAVSLVGNIILCVGILQTRAYRKPCFNYYILGINFASLIETICGFPLVVASNIKSRWAFGDTGCTYYAFLTYTCVLFTMTSYVLVSFHRYRVVVLRVPSDSPETRRWVQLSIPAACTYALCWSVCPLLGWGGYSQEPFATSCSLDWTTSIASRKIYNSMVFVFVFLLPVTFMIWSSLMVMKKLSMRINGVGMHPVSRATGSGGNGAGGTNSVTVSPANSCAEDNGSAIQTRSQRIIFMTLGIFVIFWSPYAFLSILASFDVDIDNSMSALPTIMAKSHCAINPIVYLACFRYYRRPVPELFGVVK